MILCLGELLIVADLMARVMNLLDLLLHELLWLKKVRWVLFVCKDDLLLFLLPISGLFISVLDASHIPMM